MMQTGPLIAPSFLNSSSLGSDGFKNSSATLDSNAGVTVAVAKSAQCSQCSVPAMKAKLDIAQDLLDTLEFTMHTIVVDLGQTTALTTQVIDAIVRSSCSNRMR